METKLLLVANPNFNLEELDGGIRGDLPAADREVEAIEQGLKHLPSAPQVLGVLQHAQATQGQFRTLVTRQPSIIHFAGHGTYDPQDPWLSHLKFYAKDGYDPYTVTEMMLHRFPQSPLFVMSACETARGKMGRGDEAIGILRGLTLSGATSILATNWLLNTSAAEHFMPAFYRYLFRGDSVVEALFKARQFLYQLDAEFEKPIHWAIYDLYGNPYKNITGN